MLPPKDDVLPIDILPPVVIDVAVPDPATSIPEAKEDAVEPAVILPLTSMLPPKDDVLPIDILPPVVIDVSAVPPPTSILELKEDPAVPPVIVPLTSMLPLKDDELPIDILPPVVIDVTAVVPPTCIPEAKDDVPPTVKVLAICMVPAKLAVPSDADIVAFTSVKGSDESFIVRFPLAVRPPLVVKPDAKKPRPLLLIEAFLDPLSVVTPLYIEIPP
jgi:hypothetical protein